MRHALLLAFFMLIGFPALAEVECAGPSENRPDLVKCQDLQQQANAGAPITSSTPVGKRAGPPIGLTCFTLEPTPNGQSASPALSCDQRCAAQDAVCTGMQSGGLNPATTCADPPNSLALCRCCKVVQ